MLAAACKNVSSFISGVYFGHVTVLVLVFTSSRKIPHVVPDSPSPGSPSGKGSFQALIAHHWSELTAVLSRILLSSRENTRICLASFCGRGEDGLRYTHLRIYCTLPSASHNYERNAGTDFSLQVYIYTLAAVASAQPIT